MPKNEQHEKGNKMPHIDTVWGRIKTLQGQEFETKRGKQFTFEISGNTFIPSRTNYNISKRDFEKVLDLVPLEGPGEINNLVRGPAYIWAVLHDPRVRRSDW